MSGKLCIVGYHQGEPRRIPLGHWNWMAFEILNAHFRETDTIMRGMRAGMRLVSAGILDASGLVTDTYPLSRVADAFQAATEKRDGFVKAIVEPDGLTRMGHGPARLIVWSDDDAGRALEGPAAPASPQRDSGNDRRGVASGVGNRPRGDRDGAARARPGTARRRAPRCRRADLVGA